MFHDVMLMIPGGAMPAAIVADYYDISIHEILIKCIDFKVRYHTF